MCLSNKKNTTASCTLYTANNLYFSYRYCTLHKPNKTGPSGPSSLYKQG